MPPKDVHDGRRGRQKGWVPAGGEDAQSLEWNGGVEALPGWLSRGHEVNLTGTPPARGSRGYLVTIDGHIQGVLTLRFWVGRSGGDSRSRSSRTLFEGGSVVITEVAVMGGRGWTTGWDWLIVPAPGIGWILISVSRVSMVKRTNRARRVAGGASLSSMSVSPTASTLGGAAC